MEGIGKSSKHASERYVFLKSEIGPCTVAVHRQSRRITTEMSRRVTTHIQGPLYMYNSPSASSAGHHRSHTWCTRY